MSAKSRWYLITIAALVGVVVTLALGRWQLSRAAQKESLQAALVAQAQRAVLANAALLGLAGPAPAMQPAEVLHRLVTLRGTWLGAQTIFLDNRQMNAKPGFYVLTPLLLDGSRSAVVVQRGWVARNFLDRTQVPLVASPLGEVTVAGRIAPPPSKLYALGGADTGRIRQNIDLTQFAAESGLALLPVSVVQTTPPGEDGLLRDWPVTAASADKNYGYAFQWFGLSSLIALLYVWFQIGKRFTSARR